MKIIIYFSFYLSKIPKIPILTILSPKSIFVPSSMTTPSLCTPTLSPMTWIVTPSERILGNTEMSSQSRSRATPESANRDGFFASDLTTNSQATWIFIFWFESWSSSHRSSPISSPHYRKSRQQVADKDSLRSSAAVVNIDFQIWILSKVGCFCISTKI